MTNCVWVWQVVCILNCCVPALTVYFHLGLYGNGKYSCSGKGNQSVIWNDKVCEATQSSIYFVITTRSSHNFACVSIFITIGF